MYGLPLLLAYLLAVLLIGTTVWKDALRILSSVGRPLAYAFSALVFLTLLAQSYELGSDMYPAVSWTMYSAASPVPDTWAIVVVEPEGGVHFLTPRLPGASARPILARARSEFEPVVIELLKGERDNKSDAPPGAAIEVFEHLLQLKSAQTGEDFAGWTAELRRCSVRSGAWPFHLDEWCEGPPVLQFEIDG